MIATSDIRKGNLVGMNLEQFPDNYFTVSEIGEVTSRFIQGDDVHYFSCDDMEGIPITDEWLKKYKFRHDRVMHEFRLVGVGHHIILREGKYIYRVPGCSLREIKFVHELQNLFYILTGVEL